MEDLNNTMGEGNCSEQDTSVNPDLTMFNYTGEQTFFKTLETLDYVKIVLNVLVICGSVLGNVSVILTVALNRSMRTTINFYVANLAVADLLICTCCMSVQFVNTVTPGGYHLGAFMCKFNSFNQMVCLTCSVLTLSAIACDRFMAIMFPLHVRITKQRTGVVITVIWVLSAAVSIPLLLVRKLFIISFANYDEPVCSEEWPGEMIFDEELNQCAQYKPLETIYYTFVTVTLFFLPVTIMATAYFLIIWRLYVTKVPGETHAANVNVQNRSMRKVVKMVCVVLVVFIICWMPVQILILYDQYRKSRKLQLALPREYFPHIEYFGHFIAYSNSLMNPIIYGGFNKTFRDGLCMIFRCDLRRRRLSRPQASQRSRVTFTTGITSSPPNCTTKMINGGCSPSSRSAGAMELRSPAHLISNASHLGSSRQVKDTCVTYSPDGRSVGTYT